MKTIEERAKGANPNDSQGDLYEVGQYFGFIDGYEIGASEQKEIDIEKACEWAKMQNFSVSVQLDLKKFLEE